MQQTQLLIHLVQVCLLVSIILATPSIAYGNEIIISDNFKRVELDKQLDYLFDEQQIRLISEIATEDSTLAWQTGKQHKETLLLPAGLYWIKGKITNPYDYAVPITLELKPASINVADLYLFDGSGEIEIAYSHAGQRSKFDNRPILHRNLVNTFSIAPHSSVTVIWRVEDAPMFQFKALAWSPEYFSNRDQHAQLVHGMLYGIIFVMALYNLFLFISTKEKSYLYYVLYVMSTGYLLAADEGHIYTYMNTAREWPKFAVYTAFYLLNLLMFGQFCIYFLHLNKQSRSMKRVIRALSLIASLILLSAAISDNLIFVLFTLVAVTALYIAALIAGILVRSQGVISAGHFVIAIMILVFSMIATNMVALGLISSDYLPQSLPAIGTTVMLTFFSVALADRINQLQKEIHDANIGINRANDEKLKAMAELNSSQTERIKSEQMAHQARAESQAKSDFLANMSHEIRTPMSGVLGMSELMKSTQLDENQKHYLTTIEHSGQTLLSIIDGLQDYAKIEAGKMGSELVSFNIEALLDDCISTFALNSIEKNIDFIADLAPNIDPILRGDATKLQQIILNLLSNAFKFTDTGNIVLRVRSTNRTAINCIELRFEIQDSGIGLTESEQQRLFSPFQHADKSTYGRYGGSGLGLAISKQLSELMDGEIGVDSIHGKGSCFWFTARLMVDSKPNPTLLREKSSYLTGKHLLLISSNKVIADIMKGILSSWKMDIHYTSSIKQAHVQLLSAQAKDNPYSIILSEYQLTDGNALSLANSIQESTELSPSSLVVIATREQAAQKNELSGTGIDLLLEKPVTYERLHNILTQTITAPIEQRESMQKKENQHNASTSVLLVEDNPVSQMVLTGLLSKLGIKPAIAEDGLQALEIIQHHHYDLVFMDCEMPSMDGYEATRRIRASEQRSGNPPMTIIALSAHSTEQQQQEAHLAGMDNYLIKPVTVKDLQSVIESITYPQPL